MRPASPRLCFLTALGRSVGRGVAVVTLSALVALVAWPERHVNVGSAWPSSSPAPYGLFTPPPPQDRPYLGASLVTLPGEHVMNPDPDMFTRPVFVRDSSLAVLLGD